MLINRICKKKKGNPERQHFEIYSIASCLAASALGVPPEIGDELYSMIWIEKGEGDIGLDLSTYKVEENCIYYLKPGQVLALEIEDCARGFIISFDREFFELYEKRISEVVNTPLFNSYLNHPVIRINEEARGFMKSIAEEMLQEYHNYFDLRLEILKGLLKVFIIYLSRQFESDYNYGYMSRKMELAYNFQSMLEKYFTTKKRVKEYAEVLSVTPNHLNDIVKEISGFTASYHIQKRIVLEAKRRAVFEGYSLKEIAYHLGFLDPAHFSKYFKNSSGINFTDFKKGISSYC